MRVWKQANYLQQLGICSPIGPAEQPPQPVSGCGWSRPNDDQSEPTDLPGEVALNVLSKFTLAGVA